MTTATADQIATIRARAVNATARAMMTEGVTLSHEQADDLGEEALDWLRTRLELDVRSTDAGVVAHRWHVGDRVEGGEPGTEDYDTGRVLEIDGERVLVGWDSCVQTWDEAGHLRAETEHA